MKPLKFKYFKSNQFIGVYRNDGRERSWIGNIILNRKHGCRFLSRSNYIIHGNAIGDISSAVFEIDTFGVLGWLDINSEEKTIVVYKCFGGKRIKGP